MGDVKSGEPLAEADRQQAIIALRDRYATDQITLEEFGSELDAVLNATTLEELRRVVPALPSAESAPARSRTKFDEAARLIEFHLQPGEELLWIGHPDPGKHFSPSDRYLVPFSLLWGGFALFWEGGVIAGGAPPFFALFGAAFVLMGLYFMIGRFYKSYRKRRTTYVVTSRRVMSIVIGSSGESVESTYLRSIPSVSVDARGDGAGSIMFSNTPWMSAMYLNTGMEFFARNQLGGVNFFDVPDARAVGHLVDSLVSHGG